MKKIIALLLTLIIAVSVLASCNQLAGSETATIKIGVMNGPTGMGMAKLINDNGAESEKYVFSSFSSPTDATASLQNGELDMLCAALGVECHHYARYPGWEHAPVSPLRDSYIAAFKELYGKDLSVGVIHAGLECGILSSKLDGMDIISIGPNMYDIHSPCEHLDLASCEKIWKTLVKVITSK